MNLTNEEKNQKAYLDCLERNEPSMPNDPIYMEKYSAWRALAEYPEDEWE
tara:strand:- start:1169 stop:1318 length:150 start_codon:yes stop_codon:yes gene_type:complete